MQTENLNDRRTPAEIEATIGYVVATDRFMSGWGNAPERSIFAVAVSNMAEARIVERNMRNRSEMKYVRWWSKDTRPRLNNGDHLSITGKTSAGRFFIEGGF